MCKLDGRDITESARQTVIWVAGIDERLRKLEQKMENISMQSNNASEDNKKLKPCPFCGEKANIKECFNSIWEFPHYIQCKNCFAVSCTSKLPEVAIQNWNQRA